MSIVLWYRCPLRSIPDYRLILWFNGCPSLDLRLKKHGVHQLLVMGLIALVWKQTVRYAFELGYEVIDGKRRDGRLLGHRDARGSRC